MTRVLRDPRWLAGLAVAVVFALSCVWLAQWQLDRRVARAERNTAVLENYDSPARPLAQVVDDLGGDLGADLDVAGQWQPVTMRGSYDDEGTVLVRNRPQGGSNGYLVATPFEAVGDDGTVTRVLVVRGWLPSGPDASSPGAVPGAPEGTVQVLARLRSGEEPTSRSAPPGQAYRLDLPRLLDGRPGGDAAAGAGDGPALTGAYAVLAEEGGAPPAGLAPVPRPDTDPGPHLAYGVQWYLFAVAGLVIWAVLARRHAGEHGRDEAGDPRTGDGDAPPAGDRPSRSAAARDGWVYEPGR